MGIIPLFQSRTGAVGGWELAGWLQRGLRRIDCTYRLTDVQSINTDSRELQPNSPADSFVSPRFFFLRGCETGAYTWWYISSSLEMRSESVKQVWIFDVFIFSFRFVYNAASSKRNLSVSSVTLKCGKIKFVFCSWLCFFVATHTVFTTLIRFRNKPKGHKNSEVTLFSGNDQWRFNWFVNCGLPPERDFTLRQHETLQKKCFCYISADLYFS